MYLACHDCKKNCFREEKKRKNSRVCSSTRPISKQKKSLRFAGISVGHHTFSFSAFYFVRPRKNIRSPLFRTDLFFNGKVESCSAIV